MGAVLRMALITYSLSGFPSALASASMSVKALGALKVAVSPGITVKVGRLLTSIIHWGDTHTDISNLKATMQEDIKMCIFTCGRVGLSKSDGTGGV